LSSFKLKLKASYTVSEVAYFGPVVEEPFPKWGAQLHVISCGRFFSLSDLL